MRKAGLGIGVDFGTTNSAVAIASGGEVRVAEFSSNAGLTDTYRSVLYFERSLRRPKPLAGPKAIDAYLDADERGRLIQSIKSFLASHQFQHTSVGHHRFTIENLIGFILAALRSECGELGGKVIVGRPVRFVGAETDADQRFAEDRLRRAFAEGGFPEIEFEYEPVGAAYHYESSLDHDEVILIADFGGGTSDFSVLRVGPGVRKRGRRKSDLLATAGVGLAGDAFDARMIRHMVSPMLGSESHYVSTGKELPAPSSFYRKLERWHHLSFLKSKETMLAMRSVMAQSLEPEKIEKLIDLVEHDLGFFLHRAVQKAKFELSRQESTVFEFNHAALDIRREVTRAEFEEWIRPELDSIEGALASLKCDAVDRVFLTGGTSLVPAVRRIFDERFTPERVSAGGEFTSVARGLALRAQGSSRPRRGQGTD